jgi:hypothetical protein
MPFAAAQKARSMIVLFCVAASEIPGTTRVLQSMGRWCTLFAPESSTWEAGMIQLLIGLGILGSLVVFPTGPGVLGFEDDTLALMRLIAGYLLFANAWILVGQGIVLGSEIRIWRGQAYPPPPPAQASLDDRFAQQAAQVKEKWVTFKATLCTVHGSAAFGPLFNSTQDLVRATHC